MANAIGYLRFSTPKQEHGDSRERQQRDITEYCQRKGWTLVEMVEDLGLSAYKGDHLGSGNLGKLTARIASGDVPPGTVIVVEQLDRLSRQGHRKALRWMEDAAERGIRIAVVNGDRVYDEQSLRDNMMDLIEILMKAKLAHDESVQKGLRVGAAWKRKLEATKDGEVLTKGCPGWLEPVGKGLGDQGTSFRIIPERAEIIRQVFEWCAAGDGMERIVQRLNAEGIVSWGRQSAGISMTHLRRWIEGPSAEGDFIPYFNNPKKPNGERVVGYYPRIVDADLVARARAAIQSRRKTGGRRYLNPYGNLFMSVLRCAKCSGNVVMIRGVTNEKGKAVPGYLKCSNAAIGRGCTDRALFRYAEFEAAALKEMLHLALDDRFFQRSDESLAATVALADVEKRIADLEEQQANLTNSIALVKDPTPLLSRFDEIGAALLSAQMERRAAADALRAAKGATSGPEHMQRVISVQNALKSDDAAVKLEARQKVHEAIKAVVQMVVCDSADTYRGSPEKTLTLVLVGGSMAIKFSNRGEVLGRVSVIDGIVSGDEAMRAGVLSAAPERALALDAVVRRAASEQTG